MNTEEQIKTGTAWNGPLLLCTLLGTAGGYLIADFCTESKGLLWYFGSYAHDRSLVTWCVLGGPCLGFIVGLAFDLVSSKSNYRNIVVFMGWLILFSASATYMFWLLVLSEDISHVR